MVVQYRICSAAALAAFASMGHGQATAQTANVAVGEVIVTAQKREQNVQQVPLAVLAIGAPALREAGVRDIKDVQVLAAGMTVTSTTSQASTTVRLRGIGTVGDNPGLESSVGVVVDGVYRPRNGAGFGDLGEIERVEILRGPQGTLFGKSTSAGLINIVTVAPSFTFAAEGEATASNYDGWGLAGSVTGPLVEDRVAGRLYVARRKRDGFLDVVTGAGPRTATQDDNQDYWTARGQLLLTPGSGVRARLIADYSKREELCCLAVQTVIGSSPMSRAALLNLVHPGAQATVADPFARVAYANQGSGNTVVDKGLSLQVDAPIGDATLTFITAARDWSSRRGTDWDFTAADIFHRPEGGYNDRFRTLSQEVRLSGDAGPLDWLVGGFAAREIYDGASFLLFGDDYYPFVGGRVLGGAPALIGLTAANTFRPGDGQRDFFKQTGETWALFTDNTLSLTDAWDVTAGVRYTRDYKRLDSTLTTAGGSCAGGLAGFPALAAALGAARAGPIVGGLCLPWENELLDQASGRQTDTDKRWTGSVKTSYRWTPTVMTYAAYGRGYKAGGFNFDRPTTTLVPGPTGLGLQISPTTRFAPELSTAYELGVKTEWLDRRLAVNLAMFQQSFTDFQLNTFLGTSFIVEAIPRVRSRGVELDAVLKEALPGLSLVGGVTYAQAEYGTFVAADLTDPSRFSGLARLPGSRLSFAPLWSATASAAYERPLGAGLIGTASASIKYNSRYNTGSDLAPQKIQPAFAMVNARAGVGPVDRAWFVEAWATNLTNVNHIQAAFNAPLQGGESDPAEIRTYNAFLGQPRIYGVTLRLRR